MVSYWEEWYHNNKEHHIKLSKINMEIRRLKLLDYTREYKRKRGCELCGEKDVRCLHFHHMDEEKEFSISKAVQMALPIERIKEEISKCSVLCSNCHGKEHIEDFNIKQRISELELLLSHSKKNKKQKEMVRVICDGCGKEYEVPKSKITESEKRGYKTHNCSKKCAAKGRKPPTRKFK